MKKYLGDRNKQAAHPRYVHALDINLYHIRLFNLFELRLRDLSPEWKWWEDTVDAELAWPLCKEFYEERGELEDSKTWLSVLGRGGQSVVYKCETLFEGF